MNVLIARLGEGRGGAVRNSSQYTNTFCFLVFPFCSTDVRGLVLALDGKTSLPLRFS